MPSIWQFIVSTSTIKKWYKKIIHLVHKSHGYISSLLKPYDSLLLETDQNSLKMLWIVILCSVTGHTRTHAVWSFCCGVSVQHLSNIHADINAISEFRQRGRLSYNNDLNSSLFLRPWHTKPRVGRHKQGTHGTIFSFSVHSNMWICSYSSLEWERWRQTHHHDSYSKS